MRVLVPLSLPLLCALGARIAFRDDGGGAIPSEVLQALSVPLAMGNVKEPGVSLIPSMVPPSGFEYQFKVKGIHTGTNWSLAEVAPTSAAGTLEASWKHPLALIHVECNWRSWAYGHKSHHVYSNADGKELFKIRKTSLGWLKSERRTSYRILPPGSKDDEEALFTINEEIRSHLPIVDVVKTLLGAESIFRVYRGRERDNDVVLYAEGKFPNPLVGGMAAGAGGYTFYESELKSRVLARIDQNPMYGTMEYGFAANTQNPPDKFTLKVQPGVDAALVLAASTVMDIARDLGSNR